MCSTSRLAGRSAPDGTLRQVARRARATRCVRPSGDSRLLGRLGRAGAQLPAVSNVSRRTKASEPRRSCKNTAPARVLPLPGMPRSGTVGPRATGLPLLEGGGNGGYVGGGAAGDGGGAAVVGGDGGGRIATPCGGRATQRAHTRQALLPFFQGVRAEGVPCWRCALEGGPVRAARVGGWPGAEKGAAHCASGVVVVRPSTCTATTVAPAPPAPGVGRALRAAAAGAPASHLAGAVLARDASSERVEPAGGDACRGAAAGGQTPAARQARRTPGSEQPASQRSLSPGVQSEARCERQLAHSQDVQVLQDWLHVLGRYCGAVGPYHAHVRQVLIKAPRRLREPQGRHHVSAHHASCTCPLGGHRAQRKASGCRAALPIRRALRSHPTHSLGTPQPIAGRSSRSRSMADGAV